MTNWNDYIELFPESEWPVIQQVQDIMDSQFGYDNFEAFKNNFNDIPFNQFSTEEYAEDFFITLSSWLGDIALESEGWNDFRSRFDEKAHPYIDLIIAAYAESFYENFAHEFDNPRIPILKAIEGFMETYKASLFAYMEELPAESTAPLSIITQPISNEVDWDSSYTLSIETNSSEGTTYQWRKNGLVINGANTSSLTLQNVRTENSGQYDCIVSTENDQVISQKATISVVSFSSEIYSVYGTVLNSKEIPLTNITVKVVDRKPGTSKILSTTVTDSKGIYKVEYLKSDLLDQETFSPNMVVQLFEDGATEASDGSDLIEEALANEELNFITTAFTETQTEFDLVSNYITTTIEEEVDLNSLESEDIQLLINRSFPEEVIVTYINAQNLNNTIPAVSVEHFYGMLRAGIPFVKEKIVAVSTQAIIDALLLASEQRVITPTDESTAQICADAVNGEATSIIMQSDSNPFKTVFEKVDLSEEKKENLIETYLNDPIGENDLLENSTLTGAEISAIERVVALGELDNTNPFIVDVLDDKVGTSGEPTKLTDLIAFSTEDWKALIDNDQEDLLSIPARFNGTDEEKKTAYAKELKDAVELKEPTKVLAYEMNSDSEFESSTFDQFFGDHPDFDLNSKQIAIYLDENPLNAGDYPNVIEAQKELEAAQRLFHLAPKTGRFETMKPLLSEGLNSASQIAIMGEVDFIATHGGSIGEEKAKELFSNAAHVYGRVTHALVNHTNTLSPTILTPGDGGATGSIPGIPDLETIFGSLDYCKCTHCRSVYSPAAYLVDLLNFIDTGNSHSNNLKAELIARRAEISRLFLHCDNTNTPLPYIDIVNEILENHISVNFLDLDGDGNPTNDELYYQTETDVETLGATPQNIIENVYSDALNSAIHPIELPFNLWFEQARAYLKQSNVDLGDFITAAPMNGVSVERKAAIAAAASLGISTEQLDIISGTVTHTALELYNVTNLGDLVNPVATFIDKASISYEELTELMDSKFINPLKKKIYFPVDGSCRLDAMSIGEPETFVDPDPAIGFDESELQRFNRFLRLKRLTGRSVKDLDLLINSVSAGVLNNNTIINLYHAVEIEKQHHVSMEEMITWWSDFDVATYIDEALFDKLFQDTSVNNETGLIPPLEEMNTFSASFLSSELKPLVLGALNISGHNLDIILSQGSVDSNATIQNFSSIYRIVSFSKAIGISVEEYFEKKAIIGQSGIKETPHLNLTPIATKNFIEALNLLDNSPFTAEEIQYLKSGSNSTALALKEADITDFLAQLREDYQALGIEFTETALNLEEETSALMNDFLPDRTTIDEVIEGGINALDAAVSNYFDDNFGGITSSTEELEGFKAALDAVPGPPEEQKEARRRIVYGFLQRYNHVNSDFKTATAEKLALFLNLSVDLTADIYNLKVPVLNVDTQQESMIRLDQLLFDLEFLVNNDPIETNVYANLYRGIRRTHKVAIVAKALDTSSEELNYLLNSFPTSYLNISNLPVEGDTDVSFEALKPVISLRELDSSFFSKEQTLINFLTHQTGANRISLLADATSWRESDINVLVGSEGFNFEATPEVYTQFDWINKLAKLIPLMNKTKLDALALVDLQLERPNQATAFALRNFLSSGMNKKQWLKVATPIHNKIREQKRDAMLAFLIAQESNDFSDSTDVYDHFLIDTQMSACQSTSRIKQAISAIQLFVQRIGLGFEGDLLLSADKMEEWNWRKNYRVWEANRKVFLYPENYALPEVRPNRSLLYDNFEETLSQSDVDAETVETAFQKYLEDFHEIANLEVIQMVHNDEKNELHVIAKTQNDPAKYYYRTLKNRSIWSAWELIPVDLKDGILPIIHKGKLIVCWIDERERREEPTDLTIDTTDTCFTAEAPKEKLEISLAWTTKTNEGWEAKKISKDYKIFPRAAASDLAIIPIINEFNELSIIFMANSRNVQQLPVRSNRLSRRRSITASRGSSGSGSTGSNGPTRPTRPPGGGTTTNNGRPTRPTRVDNCNHNDSLDTPLSLYPFGLKYYLNSFIDAQDQVNELNNAYDGVISDARVSNNTANNLVIEAINTTGYEVVQQQLDLIDVDQFKWVDSIEFVLPDPVILTGDSILTDVALDIVIPKTFKANTVSLLTNLRANSNDITLVTEVSNLYPLLSNRSLQTLPPILSPFFIKINNRTYIVFPFEVNSLGIRDSIEIQQLTTEINLKP